MLGRLLLLISILTEQEICMHRHMHVYVDTDHEAQCCLNALVKAVAVWHHVI